MPTRVYLGGLSYQAREKDIERFFRKYGRLREISIKNGLVMIIKFIVYFIDAINRQICFSGV